MKNSFPEILPSIQVNLISELFDSVVMDATRDCSNLNDVASIVYERQDHHDVFRKLDLDALHFIGESRDIIEAFVDQYQFSQKISVEVRRRDNQGLKLFFSGIIDNANISQETRRLVCPIIQEKKLETFLTKQETKTTLSSPIQIDIPENSILVQNTSISPAGDIGTGSNPYVQFGPSNPANPFIYSPIINQYNPDQSDSVFLIPSVAVDNVFFQNLSGTQTTTFSGRVKFDAEYIMLTDGSFMNLGFEARLEFYSEDNSTSLLIDIGGGTLQSFYVLASGSFNSIKVAPNTFNIAIDANIAEKTLSFPLNAIARLNFTITHTTDSGTIDSAKFFSLPENQITVTLVETEAGSSCNVIKVQEAFTQICNDRGLGFDNIQGYFVTGQPGANEAITNGYQLREFLYSEKPIQVSFKELFEPFNALKNLGWSYQNETIKVAGIREYYQDTEVTSFIEPDDSFTRKPNRELLFSGVKITPAFGETETYSFNVEGNSFVFTRDFDTEMEDIDNVYEINYENLYTDQYDIYITQRQRNAKTDEWELDGELFAIRLNTANSAASGQQNFSSVTGIEFPDQLINAENSPKQNLIRHLNVIGTALALIPDLSLTNFNRNVDFETVTDAANDFGGLPGRVVNEKQTISSDDVQHELFLTGYSLFFTAPISDEQLNAIDSNKFGYLSVTKLGKLYQGWIKKMVVKDIEGANFADIELMERRLV